MNEIPIPMCDRCSATCGNYQYAPGKWRCPSCIWKEQAALVEASRALWCELRKSGMYGRGDQSLWDAADALLATLADVTGRPMQELAEVKT